jgi:hypothetical protein
MVFAEAKREFQIRYYLWATSEFEKEIDESFPNLRSFNIVSVVDVQQWMRTQSKRAEPLIGSPGGSPSQGLIEETRTA